jgi:pimeloyl-ACP methyl ester carboxylesterase
LPFATNEGTRIHYEIIGDGLPIVLHTGAAGDSTMWKNGGYVDGLNGYKRILVDHRGHGLSDKPQTREAHRMTNYVSDIIAVLDSIGVYRVAFFGYSDGGRVGFSLAAHSPGRIAAIVALGSCDDIDREKSLALAQECASKKNIDPLIKAIESEEGITLPGWLRENFASTDPLMFLREDEGWLEWEGVSKVAPYVTAPVLLIAGSMEDSGSNCDRIGALLRNEKSRVTKLSGLGHVGAFLRSDLVLPTVRQFLDAVQGDTDRRYS